MVKNYFTVAIRNLRRNRVVSVINIAGLSIGLACCMLILLYVDDDWSYDRFHHHRNDLYRITMQVLNADGTNRAFNGWTGTIYGPSFKQVIPEINAYTRIFAKDYILKQDDRTFDQHIHFADSNFFSVFSFPILSGNPNTALSDLHGMVITEQTAKKYFGTTDVIGKTLEFQIDKKFIPFSITAVARNCPQNSTIKFDILLPMKFYQAINGEGGWMSFDVSTFLLLTPHADASSVLTKMTRVYRSESAPALKAAHGYGLQFSFNVGLQPLTAIHLGRIYGIDDNSGTSDPIYGYILGGIAGFILVIACINFINLTIAQAQKRSKEIGIRKVIGGSRRQLIGQFLGESFVACGISFAFAIGLALLALPVFNQLANKQLSLSWLLDARLILFSVAFFLLTGLTAGFYPALVLSGFNPVDTLYQRFRLTGRNHLGKGLAVIQFSLAGFFIISAFFMSQQFYYLTHKDLGYNDNDLLAVNLEADSSGQFTRVFRNELLTNPAVRAMARHNGNGREEGVNAAGKQILFSYEHIDENYFSTLQIPLIKGRNFSPDFPTDSIHSVIINETFAQQAGWKDPIGQIVELGANHQQMTVVGVIRDFNYYRLTMKIDPQVFALESSGPDLELDIRIAPTDKPATLAFIGSTFKKLAPFQPFDYTFVKDDNLHAYDAQEKWKQIISFSAIFTAFISCIGLFGLATLSTERRIKEIGIRKVLGASVSNLVRLLSVNFVQLVLLANLIAIPLAWWAVNKWLQNFAYRITLHWWVFALAALITLLIAWLTVGFRALKAAIANPVNNLRVE
ncbi:MAG TPA: ABC transporter permease [Puia sp.]|jgi:putative ABC transport system permease protein|nr:ABC transporter permease [Puia sp.]